MKVFKQRLRDVNLQNWSDYISNSSKCSFYSKIKNGIFINDNIQKLSYNLRYEILSILCSTHKLAIEQGRHLTEPGENTCRLCQMCNYILYNELEDEYHFVLVCPILSDVRRIFSSLWCNNNYIMQVKES